MDIETIHMIVEDDEILANEIRSFLLRWGCSAKFVQISRTLQVHFSIGIPI